MEIQMRYHETFSYAEDLVFVALIQLNIRTENQDTEKYGRNEANEKSIFV